MGARLFVGNLSHRTTETQLERFFSSWGTVVSARIARERQTGRSRGFGFVEFPNEELADLALTVFNGRELGGRALRLDRPQDSQDGDAGSDSPASGYDRGSSDGRSRGGRASDGFDDYARGHHRDRRRKGGKHGSDRKRGRGTHRAID